MEFRERKVGGKHVTLWSLDMFKFSHTLHPDIYFTMGKYVHKQLCEAVLRHSSAKSQMLTFSQ